MPRDDRVVSPQPIAPRAFELALHGAMAEAQFVGDPLRAPAEVPCVSDRLPSQPDTGVLPIPNRRTDPSVLRAVLMAIRAKGSVHVEYQSTSPENPDPIWRWISPHAFGFDGLRWHVRAFCHRDSRFKDFIIGRFLGVGEQGFAAAAAEQDWQWQTFFEVVLQPNPALADGQRRAVALDYNMIEERIAVRVRFALVYYFKKRLRVDVAERFDKPRERPIVVANQAEFETALQKADVPLSTSERVEQQVDDGVTSSRRASP